MRTQLWLGWAGRSDNIGNISGPVADVLGVAAGCGTVGCQIPAARERGPCYLRRRSWVETSVEVYPSIYRKSVPVQETDFLGKRGGWVWPPGCQSSRATLRTLIRGLQLVMMVSLRGSWFVGRHPWSL